MVFYSEETIAHAERFQTTPSLGVLPKRMDMAGAVTRWLENFRGTPEQYQQLMEWIEHDWVVIPPKVDLSTLQRPSIYDFLEQQWGKTATTQQLWIWWKFRITEEVGCQPRVSDHPLHPRSEDELVAILYHRGIPHKDDQWCFPPNPAIPPPFVSTVPLVVDGTRWRFGEEKGLYGNCTEEWSKWLCRRLGWRCIGEGRFAEEKPTGQFRPAPVMQTTTPLPLFPPIPITKTVPLPLPTTTEEVDQLASWMQVNDQWMYVRLCAPQIPLPGLLPEQELVLDRPFLDRRSVRRRRLQPADVSLVSRYLFGHIHIVLISCL